MEAAISLKEHVQKDVTLPTRGTLLLALWASSAGSPGGLQSGTSHRPADPTRLLSSPWCLVLFPGAGEGTQDVMLDMLHHCATSPAVLTQVPLEGWGGGIKGRLSPETPAMSFPACAALHTWATVGHPRGGLSSTRTKAGNPGRLGVQPLLLRVRTTRASPHKQHQAP